MTQTSSSQPATGRATMDFFGRQEIARKRTGRLVVLFVLATIAIVVSVNLTAFGILSVAESSKRTYRNDRYASMEIREPLARMPATYIAITLATLGIIAAGSMFKTASLSSGGPAVAQMMGARPIGSSAEENVLRNVVEEMSIASGVPVPQIYVMEDEDGINAFAAGFTTSDAVVAVTRGCLTRLTREELQGVVAHEFSHILNGDMRLNIRLIGILHGILVIALVGYWMMRITGNVRVSRNSKDNSGAVIIAILAAGVAMIVIGYVGLFFARLIQAGVSRQREYLADASAVQFTRNPNGLAGALKKIGQFSGGSSVHNAQALGTAHMFFASSIKVGLSGLLATHPPLVERIKAIEPTFDGRFAMGAGSTDVLEETPITQRGDALAGMLQLSADARNRPSTSPAIAARDVNRAIGRATPQSVVFAAELLASIPSELEAAAHDPFGARAVALSLLISNEESIAGHQLASMQGSLDAPTFDELLKLLPHVRAFPRDGSIALLDVCVPALRRMAADQMHAFMSAVKTLIEADGRVEVFEFAMFRVLKNVLRPPDASRRPPAIQYMSIGPLMGDAAVVLSALAYRASIDDGAADEAFARGAAALSADVSIVPVRARSLAALDASLNRLAASSPAVKRRVIIAAAETVAADGVVDGDEAELLRATCAALDVPLPPLVTSH